MRLRIEDEQGIYQWYVRLSAGLSTRLSRLLRLLVLVLLCSCRIVLASHCPLYPKLLAALLSDWQKITSSETLHSKGGVPLDHGWSCWAPILTSVFMLGCPLAWCPCFLVSLCHCVPVSLYPCILVSFFSCFLVFLCPFVIVYLCPCALVSLYPSTGNMYTILVVLITDRLCRYSHQSP